MGSGKGSPDHWVAVVKPGRVMFEMAGMPEDVAREAIRLASHKLPCKVKFIKRADSEITNKVYPSKEEKPFREDESLTGTSSSEEDKTSLEEEKTGGE
jgi:hypothetical protein